MDKCTESKCRKMQGEWKVVPLKMIDGLIRNGFSPNTAESEAGGKRRVRVEEAA